MEEDSWWKGIAEGAGRTEEKLSVHKAKLRNAVKTLCMSNDGKYFLRWLVHETGVFSASYPKDLSVAAYSAGRRSAGLEVVEICAETGLGNILFEEVKYE